jgi:hypothetical protein
MCVDPKGANSLYKIHLYHHILIHSTPFTSQLEDEFVSECKDVSGPVVYGSVTKSARQQPETSIETLDASSKGAQRESEPSDRSRVISSAGSQVSKKGGGKTKASMATINIQVNDTSVAPSKRNKKVATITESAETAKMDGLVSPGEKQEPKLDLPETTRAAKYIFDLNVMQCIIEVL